MFGFFGKKKATKRIDINHSVWADSITPWDIKRDIAINIGLYNAEKGIGYLLTVTPIAIKEDSGLVYNPQAFHVVAESVCSMGFSEGKRTGISVSVLEFDIHSVNYGIRGLAEATTEGAKTATKRTYDTTYEKFKKKHGRE